MKKNYGGMTFDTGEFDAGMKKLVSDIGLKALGPGLFAVGNAILKDAIYVSPQAPKDVGDLRGSARTEGPDGSLHKGSTIPSTANFGNGSSIGIRFGFNIEYAARWHEAVGKKINWTRDKGAALPGPKYLESKMRMFHTRYMRIIQLYIQKVLKKK